MKAHLRRAEGLAALGDPRRGDLDDPLAGVVHILLADETDMLHDAAALFALGDRDALVREVEAHLPEVRPDVRDVWGQVLASTPS